MNKPFIKVISIILIVVAIIFWLVAAMFKIMHYPYVFEIRLVSIVVLLGGMVLGWFGRKG